MSINPFAKARQIFLEHRSVFTDHTGREPRPLPGARAPARPGCTRGPGAGASAGMWEGGLGERKFAILQIVLVLARAWRFESPNPYILRDQLLAKSLTRNKMNIFIL